MKDIYSNDRDRTSFEKEIARSGSVKDYPLTVKKKDGKSVDCLITSHVIRDAGGNVRCYQGIMKERTGSRPQLKPAALPAGSGSAGALKGTEDPAGSSHIFQNIVSRNPRILDIFKMLPQIARSDSTVLIEGKSGTGKELFARAIHNLSARKTGPFVAINCAALPENLLESELFGYVKGAFTNAVNDKPGRFALAHGGTILLDEIGELSTVLQVKLLRAIQEKEIEPLGGVKSVKVDVRIISSTNRNISEEVRKGTFREDLFFRLNVVRMEIPELKDRREDIPLLIDHILRKVSSKIGKEVLHVSDNATEFLMRYDYPGNVRELENIIESAGVMCEGDTISLEDIVNKLLSNAPVMEAGQTMVIKDVLTNAEKKLIQDTLARYDGDRGKTATLLNMDRSTLWRKMKKYGLS
jgi:transcriptional regulator with PAS, ATPase and Fis domain